MKDMPDGGGNRTCALRSYLDLIGKIFRASSSLQLFVILVVKMYLHQITLKYSIAKNFVTKSSY